MPDANGQIKGITIPAPPEDKAKAQGCRCEWAGPWHVFRFEHSCPILDRHLGVPADMVPGQQRIGDD